MKKKYMERHVDSLGHIILILNRTVFAVNFLMLYAKKG
jgi:hypothetical protein